jgi:hypothetical protein
MALLLWLNIILTRVILNLRKYRQWGEMKLGTCRGNCFFLSCGLSVYSYKSSAFIILPVTLAMRRDWLPKGENMAMFLSGTVVYPLLHPRLQAVYDNGGTETLARKWGSVRTMLTFLRGATWVGGIITKWQWDDWDEGDSRATQAGYSGVLTRSPIRPFIWETFQMVFSYCKCTTHFHGSSRIRSSVMMRENGTDHSF